MLGVLGEEFKLGQNNVMMGENIWMLELAENCCHLFRKGVGDTMQNDVNITIKGSSTYKMMISFMRDTNPFEGEIVHEVLKQGNSVLVFGVNISITS